MDKQLGVTFEELADSAALDRAKGALQEELAEGGSRLASLQWNIVRDTAANALKDKLAELDWLGCLGGVWCTASELRDLATKTKAAPGTEEPLALDKHALQLDLHPVVTVTCGPIVLPPIRFTLRLGAQIDCAILIIADGRLSAIEGANLSLSASLFYGEHYLSQLAEREVPITGRYTFDDGGLPIPCD